MQENQIIFQLLEQNKMLLEEIRGLKNTIAKIEAKTDNLHRIFNQEKEEPVKELSPDEKIKAEIKRQIEAENLEIIMKISRN